MVFKIINNLDEFYGEIMKKNNNLIIAYFTATWCGPCKMISPVVQNIGENNEHITVLKIDVDECEEVSEQCNIQCMPTFNFYKNCSLEPCETMSGANKDKLVTIIQNILNVMENEQSSQSNNQSNQSSQSTSQNNQSSQNNQNNQISQNSQNSQNIDFDSTNF